MRADKLTGLWRLVGKEVNYAICPICGHPGWKFYANRHTGAWHCHAGRHRGVRSGVFDPTSMPWYISKNLLYSNTSNQENKEIILPILSKISNNNKASSYLASRHISPDTMRLLGLADWVEQHRIFIPFVGENGDVVGYTGRDYTGLASLKYRNSNGTKVLYAPDRTVGSGAAACAAFIVVVEGPMDAIACYQAGVDGVRAIALGGKTITESCGRELRRLCATRDVLVWLDTDARTESVAVVRALAPYVKSVRNWHGTCSKDAADTPPHELARFLQEIVNGKTNS